MQTKIEMGILGSQPKKQPPTKFITSLQNFIYMLNMRDLEPQLKAEVLKVAQKYPEGSLNHLYANIDHVIMKCAESISANSDIPITPEEPSQVAPDIELRAATKPVAKPLPMESRKSLFPEDSQKPKWTTVPAHAVHEKPKMIEHPAQIVKEQPVTAASKPSPPKTGNVHPLLGICVDGLSSDHIADLIRSHFSITPPLQGNESIQDD